MAETGLSYETDIVPLKKQYFQQVYSDPRIGPKAAAALSGSFSAGLDATFAKQQEIRDRSSVMRSRDLQFEAAKFDLERAREKTVRERNQMAELAPLLSTIQEINDDPTKDNATKLRETNMFAIKNAPLIAENDALKFAVTSANEIARVGMTRETETSKDYTLRQYIDAGGDLNELPEGLRTGGVGTVIPVGDYSTGLVSTGNKRLKAVSDSRAAKDAAAKAEARIKSLVTSIEGAGTESRRSEDGEVTVFKSPAAVNSIRTFIGMYGTPEEQRKAAETDAPDALLGLANPYLQGYYNNTLSAPTAPVSEGTKVRGFFTPSATPATTTATK